MKVELIAECASSHGGDLRLAKEFIKRYAEAGADWVKFQSYQTSTLDPSDPQYTWLQQAELHDDQHRELKELCEREGCKFLTTVFHPSRVPFLKTLGLDAIKIGSGEAMIPPLLAAVEHFQRVLVSTGLIGRAKVWGRPFEGLVCVSRYPAPTAWAAHLATMPYGAGLTGYSDHCFSIDVCMSAICAGATVIEKHVSLPKQLRPSQSWEATVQEFKQLRAFADDEGPAKFQGRWQWMLQTT